jgi:hypothetical protein
VSEASPQPTRPYGDNWSNAASNWRGIASGANNGSTAPPNGPVTVGSARRRPRATHLRHAPRGRRLTDIPVSGLKNLADGGSHPSFTAKPQAMAGAVPKSMWRRIKFTTGLN